MKVLVLSNRAPFAHGGAEELALNLVRNLRLRGHEAEAMRIPFAWDPYERLIDEMMIGRSLRIRGVDKVIALKFPVYLVEHPNKVIWLLHQYRQAYDLFDANQSNIPATERGLAIREMIRKADELAFRNCHSLFAIAESAKRLKRYNGITAPVLSAPLNDPELFAGGEDGGYIFAGGRVGDAKRQELLIRALAFAPGVRLHIAGPPDTADAETRLRAAAATAGVEDRVTLDIRFLAREEIARLVNHATASAYIPFEEDSVGYVTLEAFQAAKPVLTTTDSGGVLDIVRDRETGLVAEPSPEALGQRMVEISGRATAAKYGANARQMMLGLGLSWHNTIERLLA